MELSRRGFLAGLLGTAVIAVIPKAADVVMPAEPFDPWAVKAPDGTTYQWVRTALLGEADPANVQARLDNGWQFVAPTTYPSAPTTTLGNAIETHGLVLMEKPTAAVRAQIAEEYERNVRLAGGGS
jgi:hypothetical protein